jgi:hypothetical protein
MDVSVVIKRKKLVDPDDVLTPSEAALLKKAEREMKQGKYITLAQLHEQMKAAYGAYSSGPGTRN